MTAQRARDVAGLILGRVLVLVGIALPKNGSEEYCWASVLA